MQTRSRILTITALSIGLVVPTGAVAAQAQTVPISATAQIHSAPAVSGISVQGAIKARYFALGGERVFGEPITVERAASGGVVQSFKSTSGKVTDFYWRSGVGAHPISGGIKTAFDRLGGASTVGHPTTIERSVSGGVVQSFRTSTGKATDIYWKSGFGTYSVTGGVKSTFDRLGGATVVGHPISAERSIAGGVMQSFKSSTGKITDIYWDLKINAVPVSGGMRSGLTKAGGIGVTGFPTLGEVSISSSKVTQQFEKGVMQWQAGGQGATFQPHTTSKDPAPVGTSEIMMTGFITGYTYHSTDGSTAIAHSSAWNPNTLHTAVGGIGTYDDPITLAADPKIYKPGTRFYLPHVKRYFIMEDTCGACGGKIDRIDMWLGGEKADKEPDTLRCAYSVTGTYRFIVNPKRGYEVTPGAIFNSSTDTCAKITP